MISSQVQAVYVMGGNYPWDDWTEFNFNCGDNFMGEPRECFGTAQLAVNLMPPEVKVVFLGFEVQEISSLMSTETLYFYQKMPEI